MTVGPTPRYGTRPFTSGPPKTVHRARSRGATDPAKPPEDILALDEALSRLAYHDPVKAEVVRLRFFAGLTVPEVAESLEFSLATVERHWTYARTWRYAEVGDQDQE
jgi:DNA-directed RNA polymerase specialized sigma24 family protein